MIKLIAIQKERGHEVWRRCCVQKIWWEIQKRNRVGYGENTLTRTNKILFLKKLTWLCVPITYALKGWRPEDHKTACCPTNVDEVMRPCLKATRHRNIKEDT